jgi:hypothetical protein
MEFALEWGLSGKITALSMFAKLFLWSDELFENRDDTALDKYKGDSLIHFDFEGDQKNLFDSFFRVFGLDHESIMMFSFDVENYNHIQVSHLNDILPKFILKDRHHKVPTKLTSAAAIPSMLRQVFFLSGVPFKTTIEKIIETDYVELTKNLEKLITIYQTNVNVLERILRILEIGRSRNVLM